MGVLEPIILNQLDVKLSQMQLSLLQAIAKGESLTLEQKAAMDEATYSTVRKSGNNYIISNNQATGDTSANVAFTHDIIFYTKFTAGMSAAVTTLSINVKVASSNTRVALYSDNSNAPNTLLNESASVALTTGWNEISIPSTNLTASTAYWVACQFSTVDTNELYYKSVASGVAKSENRAYGAYPATATPADGVYDINMRVWGTLASTTGTIISNGCAKNSNIGLRYWGDVCANLVAGSAGSSIKMKICDSAGTPLHSNFVTIASSEYARIPLMRPVTLTATSGSQTVWNFTSLSNADAFINELGVLAKAILVELALDGTNYTVLNEVTDFNEDISNILAPKITLVSGTGVVNGTSKLRVSYIVNIPLSNTTIKLQIQLNRVAVGDTSPSITPFVGDATKYVSAGQVAII